MSEEKQLYGADLVVDSLINHDVDYVFGIPGAKIDRVFDTLEDKGPELIVARHEQNAAFMAQGVGRITGKPGVVLVTSGPGVSNLATGLVTATDEGDPVLAIGGQVKRADLLKRAHQSMNNVAMLEPIPSMLLKYMMLISFLKRLLMPIAMLSQGNRVQALFQFLKT